MRWPEPWIWPAAQRPSPPSSLAAVLERPRKRIGECADAAEPLLLAEGGCSRTSSAISRSNRRAEASAVSLRPRDLSRRRLNAAGAGERVRGRGVNRQKHPMGSGPARR